MLRQIIFSLIVLLSFSAAISAAVNTQGKNKPGFKQSYIIHAPSNADYTKSTFKSLYTPAAATKEVGQACCKSIHNQAVLSADQFVIEKNHGAAFITKSSCCYYSVQNDINNDLIKSKRHQ